MIGALPLLYHSSIGKKVIMAITGFILYGYVILHMLGNLKVYEGPEKINAYGVFLRVVGSPILGDEQLLWLVRIVLLISVILHVVAAVKLTRMDVASRPVGYATRKNLSGGYAAGVMRWGGVVIALFIVYHLLHFTTGTVHPSFIQGDIYHNMIAGFRVWYVSAFYIVAMIALGFHLYHGVWSMFQTLGLNNSNSRRFWRGLATISALALAAGNISIPIAVMTGLLR